MKRVLFFILLSCIHASVVDAQYSASTIYSSEWVAFDDDELDAFGIGMEMTATPTEICFKTIYGVGDTLICRTPYYLIDSKPSQFDIHLVGISTQGKYMVRDISRTRSDGKVSPRKCMTFEITRLDAAELHLKGELGYIRKYRRKQP